MLGAYIRNRKDRLLVLGFYLMVIAIPMLFSSLLLSMELGRQNYYWKKTKVGYFSPFTRVLRPELPRKSSNYLPSGKYLVGLVQEALTWALDGLQSRHVLGVFDSETAEPYLWWYGRWAELESEVVVAKEAHGKWAWWAGFLGFLEMAYTIFAVVISVVCVARHRAQRTGRPQLSPG